jgi:hypothetical protein
MFCVYGTLCGFKWLTKPTVVVQSTAAMELLFATAHTPFIVVQDGTPFIVVQDGTIAHRHLRAGLFLLATRTFKLISPFACVVIWRVAVVSHCIARQATTSKGGNPGGGGAAGGDPCGPRS